jgi:lambda repressor-like predicted transcriptional regulator
MLEIDGRTQSVSAWAREAGLEAGTFFTRLRRGWEPKEAMTTPLKPRRHHVGPRKPVTGTRMLEVDGRTQSMSAWAREAGLSRATLSARLEKGWGEREAVRTPVGARLLRETKYAHLVAGERPQSMAARARKAGMNPSTLYKRLRMGWDLESALEIPV